jgi:hypothetical protein
MTGSFRPRGTFHSVLKHLKHTLISFSLRFTPQFRYAGFPPSYCVLSLETRSAISFCSNATLETFAGICTILRQAMLLRGLEDAEESAMG